MGLKWFRVRMSIQQKYDTQSAPEFYRRISDSDFNTSRSQNSVLNNSPSTSTVILGGTTNINNGTRTVRVDKENTNQSNSKATNEFDESEDEHNEFITMSHTSKGLARTYNPDNESDSVDGKSSPPNTVIKDNTHGIYPPSIEKRLSGIELEI